MLSQLKDTIKKKSGLVVSEGTLDTVDLLCTAYDLLKKHDIGKGLRKEIKNLLKIAEEVNASYEHFYGRIGKKIDRVKATDLWERVSNYLDTISPKGFYFGSHEGDGACIGWFEAE